MPIGTLVNWYFPEPLVWVLAKTGSLALNWPLPLSWRRVTVTPAAAWLAVVHAVPIEILEDGAADRGQQGD